MELSKRLQTIADMVQVVTLADIGTDHGYIPIFLLQKKKITYAIASDVHKGPLQRAEKNGSRYGVLEKMDLRLGSGFSKIQKNEVDGAVVAGMGGMLTISLLSEGRSIVKQLKQLIVQPQQDIPEVRKFIHSIGFAIAAESMLMEDGKYYTVIDARPGIECYDKEIEYLFGRKLIEQRSPVLKQYLLMVLAQNWKIEEGLRKISTASSRRRQIELQEQNKQIEEAMKCL